MPLRFRFLLFFQMHAAFCIPLTDKSTELVNQSTNLIGNVYIIYMVFGFCQPDVGLYWNSHSSFAHDRSLTITQAIQMYFLSHMTVLHMANEIQFNWIARAISLIGCAQYHRLVVCKVNLVNFGTIQLPISKPQTCAFRTLL